MADPLKAEDLYPESTPTADVAAPPALPGTPPAFGELPPARNRLNTTAGSLGSSVGSAMRRMRRIPQRLTVVGGRSSQTDLQENSEGTMDEIRDAAQEHYQDWKESSRRAVYRLRHNFYHIRNEYPVQTILAFGVVGFVVGVTLRVWRAK